MSRRRFLIGLLIVAVLLSTFTYYPRKAEAVPAIIVGQLAKKGVEKALATSIVKSAGVKGNKKAIERAQEAWFSRLSPQELAALESAAANASPYANWPGWLKTTISVAAFITGADLIFSIYDIIKNYGYIEYNTEHLDEDEEFIETFGVEGVIGWRLVEHGPDSISCSSALGTYRYPYYRVHYKYLNSDGTIDEYTEMLCPWTSAWFSGYIEAGTWSNFKRYRVQFQGYDMNGNFVKKSLAHNQYRPLGVPVEYGFPVRVNDPIPDVEWEPFYPVEIPQYDYVEIYFPDPAVYPDPATAPRPVIMPPGVAPGAEPGTYPDGVVFPDPDRNPVPVPGPYPYPDPVPQPDPYPDPWPEPGAEPYPEPVPNPPNPWEPGEPGKINWEKLKGIPVLITTKFPFSLPWDIYHLLSLLNYEPRVPAIAVNDDFMGMPLHFEIDFSFLDPYMSYFRWFIVIGYAVFLILSVRKLMGGGV